MNKTADYFYLFIIPLKYNLKEFNRKSITLLLLLSVLIYTIMFIYIDVTMKIPITFLFKSIALFLAAINILGLFILLFKRWKYSEAILWSITCIVLLQYAYVIIIFTYTTFLSNFSFFKKSSIYFDSLLWLPLLISAFFLVKYFYKVNKNEAHKLNKKVILLDKKYKGEQVMIEKKNTSKRNIVLIGTLIGVGTTSIVEHSFPIFMFFLVCISFISIAVSRMIMVSYMKFKFPEQYLEKNLIVSHKKERNLKK